MIVDAQHFASSHGNCRVDAFLVAEGLGARQVQATGTVISRGAEVRVPAIPRMCSALKMRRKCMANSTMSTLRKITECDRALIQPQHTSASSQSTSPTGQAERPNMFPAPRAESSHRSQLIESHSLILCLHSVPFA